MIDKHGNEYIEIFVKSENESSLYIIFENGVSKKSLDETRLRYELSGDLRGHVPTDNSLIAIGTHEDFRSFLDTRRDYLK